MYKLHLMIWLFIGYCVTVISVFICLMIHIMAGVSDSTAVLQADRERWRVLLNDAKQTVRASVAVRQAAKAYADELDNSEYMQGHIHE